MDCTDCWRATTLFVMTLTLLSVSRAENIFHEWNVSISALRPIFRDEPVITINGMFPGPLINATTNDTVHVNVFNRLDEPLLMTWNGIKQRQNSWQDGVSGTNCPIQPGKNWTYVFQTKDQIGSFFYFPSINLFRGIGGYGPIRVNDINGHKVPFAKPESEFDLLIGDWFYYSFEDTKWLLANMDFNIQFGGFLMNGKSLLDISKDDNYTTFNVTKGKTYRFRISNVGSGLSFNFKIQNHTMVLVEAEGSYTNQITLDSLDVHVGQSYSVLVTTDQPDADYYMQAISTTGSGPDIWSLGVLHYPKPITPAGDYIPSLLDDPNFSVNQARSIRLNMTAGAAPQGTFNLTNVTLSQTFVLHSSKAYIEGGVHYAVNNVAYLTPSTPLKLADHLFNGSGVFQLDAFPINSIHDVGVRMTSVVTGVYRTWLEIVLINPFDVIDSWHLDGFGFYVVGFGNGEWSSGSRLSYNSLDPIVRSTVQVYPGGWTTIYVYLDNLGMWNLRSELLQNWYLGQELYIRVHDTNPNSTKELPPPSNLLLCGTNHAQTPAPPFPQVTSWCTTRKPSSYIMASLILLMAPWLNF